MNDRPEGRHRSRHVRVTCPHCQRGDLRIRPEHLGQLVRCKRCGRDFRAPLTVEPAVAVGSARSEAAESPAPGRGGSKGAIDGVRERELAEARAAVEARTTELDAALRDLDEARGRLRDFQEQLDEARGRLREAEGWRVELERLRSEHDRLHVEAEGLRSRATEAAHVEGILRAQLRAARKQIGRIGREVTEAAAREMADVRSDRDRLRAELERGDVERRRLAGLADELESRRSERDRLEVALGAGEARAEQLLVRIDELERRADAEREEAERCRTEWQGRIDAARSELEREIPPLREEVERLGRQVEAVAQERDLALREVEALRSDRDRLTVLPEQAEAAAREAARHEAQSILLAGEVEQHRGRLAAMSRSNEELAEQVRAARAELDRLRRVGEEERRGYRSGLDALRQDLERRNAEATAEADRAEAAQAVRSELEGHAADLEGQLRAAIERAERFEAEAHSRCDRIAELEAAGRPGRSITESDREADRLRIRALTAELGEARAANARLCSLLDVFGLPDLRAAGADPAAQAREGDDPGRLVGPAGAPHEPR